ncbi:hypothetical protein [Kitasatospora purpeofusca]
MPDRRTRRHRTAPAYVGQVGPGQEAFFDAYRHPVLPALRS